MCSNLYDRLNQRETDTGLNVNTQKNEAVRQRGSKCNVIKSVSFINPKVEFPS